MPIQLPSSLAPAGVQPITPAERMVAYSTTAHAYKALVAVRDNERVARADVPVADDAPLSTPLADLLTGAVVTGLTLMVRADYPTLPETDAHDAALALLTEGLARGAKTITQVTNPKGDSTDPEVEDTATTAPAVESAPAAPSPAQVAQVVAGQPVRSAQVA